MPERYNFVTENIDDFERATRLYEELSSFCENLTFRFTRWGGQESFFISGQAIEEDSNVAPLELKTVFGEIEIAVVFINDPCEIGSVNCKTT